MHVLGDPLAAIAGETAGIVKEGVPVVSAPQRPEAQRVIAETAAAHAAPLHVVGREIRWHAERGDTFAVATPRRTHTGLRIPLLGDHQRENCAVAVGCLDWLAERGGPAVEEATLRRGLAAVQWHGRLEILSGRPTLVLDGAQNRASAEALVRALAAHVPGTPRVLLFAMASDKDIGGTLAALVPHFDAAVLSGAPNPRAADPDALADRTRALGCESASAVPGVADALAAAVARAGTGGVVCATGSLYLVGEILRLRGQ
jgi:dihydrofolate synthase/folylpolyglutamate synthase